jgi:diguanylate cyclase (GGDEF)-like protein
MNIEEMRDLIPYDVGTLRILVVDDQAINIRTINEVLKNDYEVLMATSGEQALKQVAMHHPDLILLDIIMPGMDGHQVCKKLKDDPDTAHIPIIFITAQNDDAEEVYGFEIGAVDFISKPINPIIVKARIRNQLALKIQLDFMRNMALVDGLTGVSNRRRFDEELPKHWRQSLREQRPIGLLLIDVDYFKRFNDHYGHQAGDICLKSIAQTLNHELKRPVDLFCRYGGEEFAAILPYTDLPGAQRLAEIMIESVLTLAIPHAQSDIADTVTISIGVVSLIPNEANSYELLTELADKALYQAKGEGRNRYMTHHIAASEQ